MDSFREVYAVQGKVKRCTVAKEQLGRHPLVVIGAEPGAFTCRPARSRIGDGYTEYKFFYDNDFSFILLYLDISRFTELEKLTLFGVLK